MKKGLGRGLSALIDEGITNDLQRIVSIPLDQIHPSENQPRTVFEEEKIRELAKSIDENGLISPIIVQEDNGGYKIIAGERRFLAFKYLERREIDAIIKNVEEFEAARMTLIENVQRENLNPLEEAEAYKLLMENYNLTQEQISESIGKSRSHIANLLRILNLPDETKELISDGSLTLGHGKVLAGIKDKDEINRYSKLVKEKNLSVKALTDEVNKDILNTLKAPKKPKKKEKNIYMDEVIEDLEDYFGTKVGYVGNEKSGKIQIEYYSMEDLTRIIKLIKEA